MYLYSVFNCRDVLQTSRNAGVQGTTGVASNLAETFAERLYTGNKQSYSYIICFCRDVLQTSRNAGEQGITGIANTPAETFSERLYIGNQQSDSYIICVCRDVLQTSRPYGVSARSNPIVHDGDEKRELRATSTYSW
jgi:hypothetical protein